MTTPPDAATLPQSTCALPAGYHSVTPYLIVQASSEAIAFYGRAFGAVEVMRWTVRTARSGTPKSRSAMPA
jgi:PhnB protein